MKKLFLGLFIAGTMMSFTTAEEKITISEEMFACTVEIVNSQGTVVATGTGATCQEARARANAKLKADQ